jgi:flagellar hook-associated protein 2
VATNEIGSTLVKSITGGTMNINTMATTLAEAGVAGDKSSLSNAREKVSVEQSALKFLQSNLTAFNSYASELSTPDFFKSYSANSSNQGLVTAEAISPISQGVYSIEPKQLAQGHAIVSNQTFSSKSESMPTGTLSISLGGKETSFNIQNGGNSLENIQRIVNSSNTGVNMSIIDNGGGYQVMFSSLETGSGSEISVSGIPGLNSSEFLVSSQAQDSTVIFNGFPVTSSNNEYNELIKGVNIQVNGTNLGEKVTLEIGQNTEKAKDAILNLSELYNQMDEILDELGSYDKSKLSEDELNSEEYEFFGGLAGSSALKMISDQLRRSVSGTLSELTGQGINSLPDIGVEFDLKGKMEVDEAKLQRALDTNMGNVGRLLSKGGVASDPLIEVVKGNDRTQNGEFSVEVTQVATRAIATGSVLLKIDAQRIEGDAILEQDLATSINSGASIGLTVNGQSHIIDLSGISTDYSSKELLAANIQSEIDKVVGNGAALFQYNTTTGRFSFESTTGELSLDTVNGMNNQGFNTFPVTGDSLVEFTSPVTLGLNVDGASIQANLPAGRFLPAEIATRLQKDINSELLSSGATVSVKINNGQVEISSERYGAGSQIGITGGGTVFGLGVQDNKGVNADGIIKTSDGDLLLSTYIDPNDGRSVKISNYSVTDTGPAMVRGLEFNILGGALGGRGEIAFSQGFASRLESTINSFFEEGGLISSRLDSLTQKESQFEDKEQKLDERYERILTRYQLQFSALQSILSSTEQTKSYLSSAFGNQNN